MTTTPRRRSRRGHPAPAFAPDYDQVDRPNPAAVVSAVIAAIVCLILLAALLIPVVKILVVGYRWALS